MRPELAMALPCTETDPVLGADFANACDCHIHVNDPRYPYADGADLHPPPATVDGYRQLQRRLGTRSVVVVQPSSYGTDNRCTLDAVAALGAVARAIVVVDANVTNSEIARCHNQQARGVRFNLLRPAPVGPEDLMQIAARIAPWGWHVQLHAAADQIAQWAPLLMKLPVPVVFDHMGRLPRHSGQLHPAFAVIAQLLQEGRAWVKLSGAELDGAQDAPLYAPAAALARRYIALAPDRVVWGSNWPHPAVRQNRDEAMPDDTALLRWLLACAPDRAQQQRILQDNPARLYGFEH